MKEDNPLDIYYNSGILNVLHIRPRYPIDSGTPIHLLPVSGKVYEALVWECAELCEYEFDTPDEVMTMLELLYLSKHS